jgi:hypothetical protein
MKIYLILLLSLIPFLAEAQSFPDRCLGTWKGTMHMYSRGALKDSVQVALTVEKTSQPNEWKWKTDYLSEKLPMTKDYVLRLKDAESSTYITDEKNGIELMNYLFHDKLYTVFETEGIVLTSSYELRNEKLIFEVTSGKQTSSGDPSVTNYSVDHLQRVVLTKTK